MERITLKDKTFTPYIRGAELQSRIAELGAQITRDYAGKTPLFLSVLNGSFMFTADLLKAVDLPCEVSFVKVASYHGTGSSGKVTELIGLSEHIEGRDVIVVEDIVDTGLTIQKVAELLSERHPASLRIATLLFKPEAYKGTMPVDYVVREIPNAFVVGYGLDYDGLGRNLRDIYQIVE